MTLWIRKGILNPDLFAYFWTEIHKIQRMYLEFAAQLRFSHLIIVNYGF